MDKITEIMVVAGVPPREFDAVRPNLADLSDAELDVRLKRLAERERRFAEWRQNRPSLAGVIKKATGERPVLASVVSSEIVQLEEILLELERSNAAVEEQLRFLANIARNLRQGRSSTHLLRWFRENVPRLLALAGMRNEARGRSHIHPTSTLAEFDGLLKSQYLQALTSSNETFAAMVSSVNQKASVLLNHPLLSGETPLLTWAGTIEALARIQNVILRFPPDVIVAGNEEGRSIAELILDNLKLKIPICVVHGTHNTELKWTVVDNRFQKVETICVIGHLARSGRSMVRFLQESKSRFEAQKVYGAVLASSLEASARVSVICSLVHHQYSTADTIQLDFDPAQGVAIEEGDYRFRDRGRTLPVTSEDLEIARSDVAKVWPDTSPPWMPVMPVPRS